MGWDNKSASTLQWVAELVWSNLTCLTNNWHRSVKSNMLTSTVLKQIALHVSFGSWWDLPRHAHRLYHHWLNYKSKLTQYPNSEIYFVGSQQAFSVKVHFKKNKPKLTKSIWTLKNLIFSSTQIQRYASAF